MPKYFVDTNIFLRTLVPENKKSLIECKNFLSKIKNNQIDAVTSNLVLTEIVWTLLSYYKFPKRDVIAAVRSVLNLSGLKIVDGYNTTQALIFYENKTVKFIDCLISSIPEIKNKEWFVVSYDEDFDRLGVLRKDPGEVILKN